MQRVGKGQLRSEGAQPSATGIYARKEVIGAERIQSDLIFWAELKGLQDLLGFLGSPAESSQSGGDVIQVR